MKEINGNLIKLAKQGKFNIIVHGCNCFCTMNSGIAKQIRDEFHEVWLEDQKTEKGDITKLGNYTKYMYSLEEEGKFILVVNAYTQYTYDRKSKPLDYDALILVIRKLLKTN